MLAFLSFPSLSAHLFIFGCISRICSPDSGSNLGNIMQVTLRLQCTVYQRKVDMDMLNAVKSVLAEVSRVSPSSEQKEDML